MKTYAVTLSQHETYDIEAENEDDAYAEAEAITDLERIDDFFVQPIVDGVREYL